MKGIADTGFLVAFANKKDHHHAWAVELARQIDEPFLTCEAVLAETAFHLQNTAFVLDLISDGLVRLAFDMTQHLPELAKISERFSDRKPDLADVCLIRLSELYPKHPIFTVDFADFRVYRRHRNEAIPLVTPPS